MTRVVVAEDHLLVREGVVSVLTAAGFTVAAVCADAEQLRDAITRTDPDVVVTDIHMPPDHDDDGIQVARELRRDRPGVGVVVLSNSDEPGHALALLEGGSQGRAYLLKERVAQPGQLAHAVTQVAAGGSVIDPRIVESLITATHRPASSPLAQLSPREREVLEQMAAGKANQSIAQALFLSGRGVERHINSLFAKLALTGTNDYHHRVRAVLLYLSEH